MNTSIAESILQKGYPPNYVFDSSWILMRVSRVRTGTVLDLFNTYKKNHPEFPAMLRKYGAKTYQELLDENIPFEVVSNPYGKPLP